MSLGSTQPLTEISIRGEGKGGRCVGLQPYQLGVPIVMKSRSLNVLSRLAQGWLYPFLTLHHQGLLVYIGRRMNVHVPL